MVMVAVPSVAFWDALSVSTVLEVVGLLAKVTVTPLDRPDAASLTDPLNPPASVTEMVLVALLFCLTDKLAGEAERVKPGLLTTSETLAVAEL